MEQWNHTPLVIRQKLIVTLLTGAGCLFITIVFSIAFHDQLLLYLGLTVTVGCIFRGRALWNTIRSEAYETVTGICIDIFYPKLHKYKKIKLSDENGVEFLLLLDRRTMVVVGGCYCFYFQKNTGSFLGHKKIERN